MKSNFGSPTEIDVNTQKLVSMLNTGTRPVILAITPALNATFGNCFFNVEDKVKIDGGTACLGWAILRGGAIIEAEAHAVWKSPDGELMDITPRESNFTSASIMFLEDPNLKFRGSLIDNRRLNATGHPLVDHVIRIAETIVAIQVPCTKVMRGIQTQPEPISKIVSLLQADMQKLSKFINEGGQLTSPCFCNSGYNYLNCHGRIDEGMFEVMEMAKEIIMKYNLQ